MVTGNSFLIYMILEDLFQGGLQLKTVKATVTSFPLKRKFRRKSPVVCSQLLGIFQLYWQHSCWVYHIFQVFTEHPLNKKHVLNSVIPEMGILEALFFFFCLCQSLLLDTLWMLSIKTWEAGFLPLCFNRVQRSRKIVILTLSFVVLKRQCSIF